MPDLTKEKNESWWNFFFNSQRHQLSLQIHGFHSALKWLVLRWLFYFCTQRYLGHFRYVRISDFCWSYLMKKFGNDNIRRIFWCPFQLKFLLFILIYVEPLRTIKVILRAFCSVSDFLTLQILHLKQKWWDNDNLTFGLIFFIVFGNVDIYNGFLMVWKKAENVFYKWDFDIDTPLNLYIVRNHWKAQIVYKSNPLLPLFSYIFYCLTNILKITTKNSFLSNQDSGISWLD